MSISRCGGGSAGSCSEPPNVSHPALSMLEQLLCIARQMEVRIVCLMLFIQIWKGWLCKDQRKMVLV